ncbi:MAG: glycosyltransferase family 4 protein [Alphaproteobacteria bacterium]
MAAAPRTAAPIAGDHVRVLHLVHNHPDLHAGGTEIFARELFQALREMHDTEGRLVAAVDSIHRRPHPGTNLLAAGADAEELLLWSGHFDRFHLNQPDTEGALFELAELVESFAPDVVHFHHLLMVGANAIPLIRRVRPDVRIVLSLHDYHAICHRDGVMLQHPGNERCDSATPNRCHGCFPEIDQARFRVRELMLKAHLAGVDRFVAPSRFLRDRYVAWGLPGERIEIVPNGRKLPDRTPKRRLRRGERRSSFAVLGNLSPYKGTPVALAAAARLIEGRAPDFTLRIFGGHDFQSAAFVQAFDAGIARLGSRAIHHGRYRADQVAALLADVDWVIVPSIWWENAPLVVDEAMHHRRPVICSDIGGLAERVRDGVDGLLFRAGDPVALAEAMERAMTEPGLWQRLSDGIRPVRTIERAAAEHLALYRSLSDPPEKARARRRAGRAAADLAG